MHNINLHESHLKHPAYGVGSVKQYRQMVGVTRNLTESKFKAFLRRIINFF